jgi:hypothetical protein
MLESGAAGGRKRAGASSSARRKRITELTFWGSTMGKRRNRFERWVVTNPITVSLVVVLLGMLSAYVLGFFEGLKHAGH